MVKVKIILESRPDTEDKFQTIGGLISTIHSLQSKFKDGAIVVTKTKCLNDRLYKPVYELTIKSAGIPYFKDIFLGILTNIPNFNKYWNIIKY